MTIGALTKHGNFVMKESEKYITDILRLRAKILLLNPNFSSEEKHLIGDTLDWLKIAEGTFKFWDNEIDEAWNDLNKIWSQTLKLEFQVDSSFLPC